MDFFNFILGALGLSGVGGVLMLVLVVAVVVLALYLAKRFTGDVLFNTILQVVHSAVLAVEKFSDNGQFAGMTPEQKNAARKALAVQLVTDGLQALGIKTNAAMLSLISTLIEYVVKQLDPIPAPTPTPTPPKV